MSNPNRMTAIAVALLIWGFAGGIFGALFAGLYGILGLLGLTGWVPLVAATAAAAMTTSAFYSAMPLALTGAMAGILASIGYLIASDHRPELAMILGIAGGLGLLAGAFQFWMASGGGRPLAETLTGLLAGLGAGGILALVTAVFGGGPGTLVMAAGVVALVGSLFQISERWLVTHAARWLPGALSAPVVAGLVAAVVGASVWILGGATALMLDRAAQVSVERLLDEIPLGLLGGLLGGLVTGLLLELLGFHLEDRD